MMKENTFDLLIYVYEEFIGSDFWGGYGSDREEQFIETFYTAGYGNKEIEFYVDWFNQTFAECDDVRSNKGSLNKGSLNIPTKTPPRLLSKRHYSTLELNHLGGAGALFLETLVTSQCISIAQRELIIERTVAINAFESIEIDQLKWLTLMITINQNENFQIDAWRHQFIVNWLPDYDDNMAVNLN